MNMASEVGVDHLTMLDVSPPDLVSVAREAGFDLVSLRVVVATPSEEPWPMTASALMLEETARRLDDTGVRVLSVEVVRVGPVRGGRTTSRRSRRGPGYGHATSRLTSMIPKSRGRARRSRP